MAEFTVEDNARMTQTGAGTPMGELFRRYWLPAFVSKRLPTPGGEPVEIKLLSDAFIAARDAGGTVSIRSSEKSFPTWEAGRIVWTYVGPPELQPEFPNWLFTSLPDSHIVAEMYLQDCNYLQGLEADLDFVHGSYLHGNFAEGGQVESGTEALQAGKMDAIPSELGVQLLAHWPSPNYPGCNEYLKHSMIVPCFTSSMDNSIAGGLFHAWVPIDDEHHLVYYVHFDEAAPLTEEERLQIARGWGHDLIDPAHGFRSLARKDNKHLQNWARYKKYLYSGIPGVSAQDLAIISSMGPIVDRSLENLGAIDVGLVRLRRYLLRTAAQFDASGKVPRYPAHMPDAEGAVWVIPGDATWRDALEGRVKDMRRDVRTMPLSKTTLIAGSIQARDLIAREAS
jgi:phthalate 4,5-dioxygenase oxygenase subunit